MKKIVLLLLLLIASSQTFAQKFEVTPNGLRDKEKLDNTYLVLDAEGKTAKELYDKAIAYINEKYKNPDKVIKGKTEGEYLKFETFVPELFVVNNSGAKIPIDVTFTTELRFKDGKVKYEIISLDMGKTVFSGSIWSGYPIYNAKKDNKLRLPETKEFLEVYFTGQATDIKTFVNGESKKDEW